VRGACNRAATDFSGSMLARTLCSVEISAIFPECRYRISVKVLVEKVGGIWHGRIEGHPEIDERGLTAETRNEKRGERRNPTRPRDRTSCRR
jgi:hypothetical protein